MNQPLYLSDHFSYAEATISKTASKLGIVNIPSDEELTTLYKTAECMERVRELCGNKVVSVSSWYRSIKLNRAIGSKDSSQHTKGEAVDFNIFRFGTPRQVCERIATHKELINFDQLILENGWIHISFRFNVKPRGQVLTITPDGKAHLGLIYYK